MKQIYVLLLVVFLPLFAHAGLLDRAQQLGNNFPKSPSREFRLTHQISSYYEDGVSIQDLQTMFYYSNNHPAQVDSVLFYFWEENEWQGPESYIYPEYNAAGMVISNIMLMDLGFQMFPVMRTESFFDAQNRITHFNIFNIDFDDMQTWIPSSRNHMVYGQYPTFEVFGWDSGWGDSQNYYHGTFSYDSSGRFTEELTYDSPDSTNWVLSSKDVTVYHPQDTSTGADVINYISQMYGSILFMSDLDMPLMISSATSYLRENDSWIPDYRTIYEYDGSLRRIRQDEEYWDGDQWTAEDKVFFYYDTNGNLSSSIEQYSYAWGWEDATKTEYFWEGFTISNEDLVQDISPALQIKAWPIPFVESLNISTSSKLGGIPQISIYNSRGQLIREYKDSDSVLWDGKDSQGRDSATGIYFIRAWQDKASAVSKVIRVK